MSFCRHECSTGELLAGPAFMHHTDKKAACIKGLNIIMARFLRGFGLPPPKLPGRTCFNMVVQYLSLKYNHTYFLNLLVVSEYDGRGSVPVRSPVLILDLLEGEPGPLPQLP